MRDGIFYNVRSVHLLIDATVIIMADLFAFLLAVIFHGYILHSLLVQKCITFQH